MSIADLDRFQLGRAQPSRYDRHRITLDTPAVAVSLPDPPSRIAPGRVAVTNRMSWTSMGNDVAGDCTYASAGHTIQYETTYERRPWQPSDQQVLAAYFAATGGADDGLTLLDVLKPWRSAGLWGHRLSAYAELPLWPGVNLTRKRRALRQSIWLAGSAYLAFSLPAALQRHPYDWESIGDGPEWRTGSWGGHAVPAIYYIARQTYVVTWGRLVPVSEAFLDRYCDEGWMPVSEDWINAKGNTPNGRPLAVVAELASRIAA